MKLFGCATEKSSPYKHIQEMVIYIVRTMQILFIYHVLQFLDTAQTITLRVRTFSLTRAGQNERNRAGSRIGGEDFGGRWRYSK